MAHLPIYSTPRFLCTKDIDLICTEESSTPDYLDIVIAIVHFKSGTIARFSIGKDDIHKYINEANNDKS